MTISHRLLPFVAVMALTGTAGAADLADVYRAASLNDPRLREAEAAYRSAREAKPQAWANYLPQITGNAYMATRDSEGAGLFYNGTVTSFTQDTSSSETGVGLELRQTVFSWDRIRAIGQAGSLVARAEANWQAARQDLMVRTAQRYFDQLSAQDALGSSRANREAIGRQLEQAKKRFEVGLIAVTDVQESQAAFDTATADEIAAERAYQSSRELLREITGDFTDDLSRPGERMPLVTPDPATPEAWVKLASAQNLALVAARANAEATDAGVGRARSGHLPTLDFIASMSKSDSEFTDNLNPLVTDLPSDDTSNSMRLQLSVPLFAGGATQSRLRQAQSDRYGAEAQLERVTRETQRQARDALLGVTSEISRTKALRQATESSATALRATEAGFEVGTRTTVDVLQARGNLLRSQVTYQRSKYDYLLNTLRLKQAAGTLVEADLQQVNSWLTTTDSPAVAPNPTK